MNVNQHRALTSLYTQHFQLLDDFSFNIRLRLVAQSNSIKYIWTNLQSTDIPIHHSKLNVLCVAVAVAEARCLIRILCSCSTTSFYFRFPNYLINCTHTHTNSFDYSQTKVAAAAGTPFPTMAASYFHISSRSNKLCTPTRIHVRIYGEKFIDYRSSAERRRANLWEMIMAYTHYT